jgi:hypothetical protein
LQTYKQNAVTNWNVTTTTTYNNFNLKKVIIIIKKKSIELIKWKKAVAYGE